MSKLLSIFFLALVTGFLFSGSGLEDEQEIVSVRVVSSVEKLKKEKSSQIAIEIKLYEPWHVNSNKPEEDFLIPTEIEFEKNEYITYGRIKYPTPVKKTFAFTENPIPVFEGTVYVYTSVTLLPDITDSTIRISGTLRYQACNDESCLAPARLDFSVEFPIAETEELVREINQGVFKTISDSEVPESQGENGLDSIIKRQGILFAFIIIFVGGLALNLTPCVYPLIPITISYFGGQVGGRKTGLFLHGIVYVLGMSVTYSTLGVVAALTGSILGGWLQNPTVLIFIALTMILLALGMFGLYEIRVPAKLSSFAGQSKQGYFGTIFMGLTVGIIAAPCIGPFVLALLTYVGERGDPFMGFLMFFVLSIGLGIPFIVLALFSGMINYIPRSGAWMEWVRKIFGFILVGMALYFLNPLFASELWYYSLLAITFLLGGIYMAWIEPTKSQGKIFPIIRNLVGILFLIVAVFFMVTSVEAHVDDKIRELKKSYQGTGLASTNEINWLTYSEQYLSKANEEGKPIMIDFYADWCIPCKELDKFTFTDPQLIKLSREFIMLKADLTKSENEEVKQLKEKYNIKGVPTIVFLSSEQHEVQGTRVVGFMNAEKFVDVMNRALQD
jgi:thiol:disulfide interchange protein DsbD